MQTILHQRLVHRDGDQIFRQLQQVVDWAQFLLFHVPAISNKDLLLWLVGLVHLVFLFHRARPAAATTQLQDRLREKGVVPELYTFSRFEQPCAVYVKLKFPKLNHSGYPEISKDTSFCYVGSTNLTVAKSEYNRVAKLKQLKQLKLPKTEIAIRYWHDKQNYELFSTLLLSQHQEYIDAWAEEHCLIQRWQPKLNYPFVTKELLKKAHGLGPARQQPHLQKPPDTLAKQLFKKIRRRLQGQKRHLANALPKQAQFWKILYAISSDTKQEHDASRELRSGKHDNETVTLLYRLANHMEQPWRSKARARLRRVLTFRNATVPKYNLPLKIPFLAHNDFKSNAQKCMGIQAYSTASTSSYSLPPPDQNHTGAAAPRSQQSPMEPYAQGHSTRATLGTRTVQLPRVPARPP